MMTTKMPSRSVVDEIKALKEAIRETNTTFPQLFFHINNINDPNHPISDTIYATPNAQLNHLQLKISTNIDITFVSGNGPVPQDQASSCKGSLLYLDLSPLQLDSIDASVFTAPGWKFQVYDQVVCLYVDPAVEKISLTATDTLSIDIASLAVPRPPSGPGLMLVTNCYHVTPITAGNLGIPFNFKVMLQNPPQGNQNLQDQIAFSVKQPADIINTIPTRKPVSNALTFTLSPTSKALPVKAGSKTTFTLSFVYGTDKSGYGALTTAINALNFQVTTFPQGWTCSPNTDAQNPSWTFVPKTDTPLVGTGPEAVIEFTLDHIITSFKPGSTLLYFSYQNVPGYEDGSYYAVLNKIPHVDITSFNVSPYPVELKEGSAEITLSWETSDATQLTLSGPAPLGSIDVTGQTQYSTTITKETLFTLKAVGKDDTSGNIAYANSSVQILPVVNSFAAVPSSIYYQDFPYDVSLNWNVNTNNQVQITTSQPGIDPILAPAKRDNFLYHVQCPQTLTLSPASPPSKLNEKGLLSKERSLALSAFQIASPRDISLAAAPSFVAISPTDDFIAVTNSDQGSVSILDTINYQPIQNPIPVGKNPLGLIFSPDGNFLYTANSGDGTISTIQITRTDNAPPTFTPLSPLNIGGAPQQLAQSQDGQYLYVTVDQKTQIGSLVILHKAATGTLTAVTSIFVGKAPRGLAVLPSDAQIYVANSADDTLSIIQASLTAKAFTSSDVISLPAGSKPQGTAIASAPNFPNPCLLVACSGSNIIYAFNTAYPDVNNAQSIPLADQPQQIALMQGNQYAFISCGANSSIALLGYTPSLLKWHVLESNIGADASKKSVGIAIPPEGGTLIVANQGNTTLSTFTLATYLLNTKPTDSVGLYPTDVMVTSDSSRVLTWHNAFVKDSRPAFQGIQIYDIASSSLESAPIFANQPILGCVTSSYLPASHPTAFVITLNSATITVLQTTPPYATTSINLPKAPTGEIQFPCNIALSLDGLTLYVITRYNDTSHRFGLIAYSVDTVNGNYPLLFNILVFTATGGTSTLLCVSPDGSKAYVTDSIGQAMWMVNYDAAKKSTSIAAPLSICQYPSSIAIMPDGSQVFVLGKGQSSTLWRLSVSDQKTRSVTLPESVGSALLNKIAISPDGSTLYASDAAVTGLRCIDPLTLRFTQTLAWTQSGDIGDPWGIAILPDASQIFTANHDTGNLGIIHQVQPSLAENLLPLLTTPPYYGFFMRHQNGEVPSNPQTTQGGLCQSPDVISTGPTPANPLIYLDQANYDKPFQGNYNILSPNVANYVYVRGYNNPDPSHPRDTTTARIWLYLVNGSLCLLSQNWNGTGIIGQNPYHLNYIEFNNLSEGLQITKSPFTIDANQILPNTHYCFCAIAENVPLSDPPVDPRPGQFNSYADLVAWVNGQANYAWLNTADVPNTATWSRTFPVSSPPEGGAFNVGIQCNQMPIGGLFSYTIPGPDGATIVNPTPITSANQRYSVPVTWPKGYSSTMSITYQGAPTFNPSSITAYISVDANMVQEALERANRPEAYIRYAMKKLPLFPSYCPSSHKLLGWKKSLVVGGMNCLFPKA